MERPQSIGEIQNLLIDSTLESKSTVVQEDEETIIAYPAKEEVTAKKNKTELDAQDSNVGKKKRFNKKNLWGLAACLLLLLIIIISGFYFSSRKTEASVSVNDSIIEVVNSIVEVPRVERMQYTTAIGGCQYTGPVDEQRQPNGEGEAFFNDGRYYSGTFEHGVLTGNDCYFEYSNGDTFRGKFRNNAFYYGTYTIASDGSYYVGSYKNGQPDGGTWYDKNGKVIENI